MSTSSAGGVQDTVNVEVVDDCAEIVDFNLSSGIEMV
jgi:hypothetical protein